MYNEKTDKRKSKNNEICKIIILNETIKEYMSDFINKNLKKMKRKLSIFDIEKSIDNITERTLLLKLNNIVTKLNSRKIILHKYFPQHLYNSI